MAPLLTDRETNGQMDECNPPSLRFCPFLNIPDSSKRKNPECFYTRTIKAVYSNELLMTFYSFLYSLFIHRLERKCTRCSHIAIS